MTMRSVIGYDTPIGNMTYELLMNAYLTKNHKTRDADISR